MHFYMGADESPRAHERPKMKTKSPTASDVDAYIAGFPKTSQALLRKIRAAIRKAAPEAEEGIGYQMPAYTFHGPLVYFAGYEHHIGFYPGSAGIADFKRESAAYKSAKGTLRFPIDEPLPLDLVARIVAFRVRENGIKAKLKAKGKAQQKAKAKPKSKPGPKPGPKSRPKPKAKS